MRALILVAGAALALAACSSNDGADNNMAVDNLTVDNLVIDNTTAIDTNMDANMAMDNMTVNDMNAVDTNAANNTDQHVIGAAAPFRGRRCLSKRLPVRPAASFFDFRFRLMWRR